MTEDQETYDMTWTMVDEFEIKHTVIYGEKFVRDWRRLWLKRRRKTYLIGVVPDEVLARGAR